MNLTLLAVTTMAFLIALAAISYSWVRYRPFAYVTIVWFLVALVVAQIPFFQNEQTWMAGDGKGFIAFGTALMVPVVGLLLAWQKSSAFRAFLEEIPTWLLVSTQVYRMAGIFFLLAWLQGTLPWQIGLVNGVLDVAVATGAVLVATLVYKYGKRANAAVLVWCGLGLLDFALAFTVVGLSFLGMISIAPAPASMGMPPLTLISIFQVPLAMFIHIYLIARIRKSSGQENSFD